MKLVIRADDVGYTDVCNIGTFKTLEQGISTSADVMLDTPGTEDALLRLGEMPWISVGWHTHFWGTPILDPSEVPSLVEEDQGRIRFRKDLRCAEDVVFEQALRECRTQIDKCVRFLGRAPDVGMAMGNSSMDQAIRQVCSEYGIAIDFAAQRMTFPGMGEPPKVDDQWAGRNISFADAMPVTAPLLSDDPAVRETYDPVRFFLEDQGKLLEYKADEVAVVPWHPGYLDDYVYKLGDYGPFAQNFLFARLTDVKALCAAQVKNWIRDKKVELVNMRDALYGTREYQNYLKSTGSDLALG